MRMNFTKKPGTTLHFITPSLGWRLVGVVIENCDPDAVFSDLCFADKSLLTKDPGKASDYDSANFVLAGLMDYPVGDGESLLSCRCSDPSATVIAEFS